MLMNKLKEALIRAYFLKEKRDALNEKESDILTPIIKEVFERDDKEEMLQVVGMLTCSFWRAELRGHLYLTGRYNKESDKHIIDQGREALQDYFKEHIKTNAIKVRIAEVYELHVKCEYCGASDVFTIGERKDMEDALSDVPTKLWNGWIISPEHICPSCQYGELLT